MKKIYIWGIGALATNISSYIDVEKRTGFIDTYSEKQIFMGKKVCRPIELKDMEYDAIIVALSSTYEISQECLKLGIDKNKVIYLYNNFQLNDMNCNYDLITQILGNKIAEQLKSQCKMIPVTKMREGSFFENCHLTSDIEKNDFIRFKSLDLVTKEIKKRKLSGAVAEVGVFRGDFAQYIHYAYPEKKCYLFDTFQSFDIDEAHKEIDSGNINNYFYENFKNTSIDLVLSKMINPKNVIIKQGLFPQSLDGLEESFCFVSIDVDLEDSIYECMNYFYPRLVNGGYIFVHDYNSNMNLFGVESAIDKYEQSIGKFLPKVPIVDTCGSLIITK